MNSMSANIVPSGKMVSRTAEIWFDHRRILHVKIFKNAEIDKEDVDEMFEIYRKMGCEDKPVLQVIDGREIFLLSLEARARAAELGDRFFIASAVIGKSLTTRLLVNFFIHFNKPNIPFRIFPHEAAAIKWLLKFTL